jgi:opacity protein-like surface antigen
MKKTTLIFVVLLGSFAANSLYADGLYVGARTGYMENIFTPDYTAATAGYHRSFYDKAYGLSLGLLSGYAWQFNQFGISLQANVDANNAKWDLNQPTTQSYLEYKIPYNYGISVLPSYDLTSKLSVYAELGLQRGYIKEVKTSALADSYSAKQTVTGVNFGGGLGYVLTDKIKLDFGYQQINYQSISYSAYNPDGAQIFSVKDEPYTRMFNLGIKYFF